MNRRAKIWQVVAVLFTLVNLGGAWYAARAGERQHADLHVVLTLVGLLAVWALATRARRDAPAALASSTAPRATLAPADGRLDQLQQSIDAVAIEVERIGEAQRFDAKLRAERGEPTR